MSIHRRKFLELSVAAVAAATSGCAPVPKTPTLRTTAGPLAGKIDHFIVLMMENRSYDQMLGALPGERYDGVPRGTQIPYDRRDGSRASIEIRRGAPPDSFSPDPQHNFQAVSAQIYGDGFHAPPNMAGFAKRYAADHPSLDHAKLEAYMTLYGEGRLPILQQLAKEYGVCTHWFSSLPSSTMPNRMFAHAGTSAGVTRAGAYYTRIRGQMIFDKLGDADRRGWRVYFHDLPHLWLSGDAWTKMFSGHFHHIGAFENDVQGDKLATYTFIEPQHVIPPWSSQHPSGGVSHGEKLIANVYNTLVANPRVFEKSLLLIVYDEHGGFYDHVLPPGHAGWEKQCPGVEYRVVRPDNAYGMGKDQEAGYAFDTLGPRVPAVVVSPWIERGSVFGWKADDPAQRHTFDHTSILATVGKLTGVWVDSKRALVATPLDVTVNRASPRTDYVKRLAFDAAPYRRSGAEPDGDLATTPTAEPDAPDAANEAASADAQQDPQPEGIAKELFDAYRAENGEGTPRDMVEHYQTLVEK